MTLTAHAIVGAGVAATMTQFPVLGITLAFGSHFLLDAIPHYDYRIRSASIHPEKGGVFEYNQALILDFLSIALDFVVGLLLGVAFFATPETTAIIGIAAFMGMFPDALQFAYARLKREPFISIQRFHKWMHTKHHLREYPIFGVISQIVFVALIVVLLHMYLL